MTPTGLAPPIPPPFGPPAPGAGARAGADVGAGAGRGAGAGAGTDTYGEAASVVPAVDGPYPLLCLALCCCRLCAQRTESLFEILHVIDGVHGVLVINSPTTPFNGLLVLPIFSAIICASDTDAKSLQDILIKQW